MLFFSEKNSKTAKSLERITNERERERDRRHKSPMP